MSLPIPATDAEREAIREQLERILADPLFRNSKRYPSLLRFVVERALSGNVEHLKERDLGVEIFGRDPDYDTNLEPIVRTTAVEVRKRIAHYYQEPSRQSELRIDLPPGSYVPEFRFPAEVVPEVPVAEVEAGEPVVEVVDRKRRWPWLVVSAVALAAISFWIGRSQPWSQPTAVDRFWRPILSSGKQVLLCIGGPRPEGLPPLTAEASDSEVQPPIPSDMKAWQVLRTEYVALADTTTLSRVAALLHSKGRPYQVRGYASTTFADLRNVPAVLVGAYNNPWALRFSNQLRFSFAQDRTEGPGGREVIDWIRDRENPGRRNWEVNTGLPYLKVTEDYAIVSRVFDPNTQETVVIVGGLLKWGTVAAGEFLTDPSYMEEVAKKAPANWERMNMQAVIGTRIISGISGPPRVLAVHFW